MNNVGPGPMDTYISTHDETDCSPFFYPAESPDSIAYHKSASTNGELTKIEDIAPIVMFLATNGWWITGPVSQKDPISLTLCRLSLPMVAIRRVRLMRSIYCMHIVKCWDCVRM